MQTQHQELRIQPPESVNTATHAAQTANGIEGAADEDVYLTECASCGGQFPTFRAICDECEDVAEADGYRDGRKAVAKAFAATLRRLGIT